MTDRDIRRKQIRTVVVLSIIVILCGIGIFRLLTGAGQGDYAGLNFDRYIEVGDYKHLKIDMEEDDPDSLQNQIWMKILENTKVKKYPKKQVEAYLEENLTHYEKLAGDYGYETFDDYVKNEFSIEREDFEEQLKAYAESEVKNDLTVCAIAEKEGITISDEEYAELLEKALKDSGLSQAEFEEQFEMSLEEYAEKKNMRVRFLQNKVMQVITENLAKE